MSLGSLITLVAKCKTPEGLGDYRHISVARIQLVISPLIGQTQMTFVKGRQILDALLNVSPM